MRKQQSKWPKKATWSTSYIQLPQELLLQVCLLLVVGLKLQFQEEIFSQANPAMLLHVKNRYLILHKYGGKHLQYPLSRCTLFTMCIYTSNSLESKLTFTSSCDFQSVQTKASRVTEQNSSLSTSTGAGVKENHKSQSTLNQIIR